MYLADLADACRKSGLRVVEQPGWKTRGHGDVYGVRSIICHHTAGPATGEAPSLGVVTNGRPGLAGPLAQLVLGRSGTVYVVAAGLCYHAGATFEAWQGNAWAIGIEAEATGRDHWPTVQYAAYVKLCRALADHYGVPYDRVRGHCEVAAPLGRKTDPNFSMAAFRAAVSAPQEDPIMWEDIVTNMNGDRVQAIQVLNGVERRTADAQNAVARVEDKVNALTAAVGALVPGSVVELPEEPAWDLEALASAVADKLAARLAS